MKNILFGLFLILGLGLSKMALADDGIKLGDFDKALKGLNKNKTSGPQVASNGAESSVGEEGEICTAANQVPYQLLEKIVKMDSIEFELNPDPKDKTKEVLTTRLPITHHTCFCPKLQAFKQDGKVFVIVENDFFNQNEAWLKKDGKFKSDFTDESGSRLKTTELYLKCVQMAKDNKNEVPSLCAGGKRNLTADNTVRVFSDVVIKTPNDDKKDKDKKDLGNDPKTASASVPIFYLTNSADTTFIGGYNKNKFVSDVTFDPKKFSDQENCQDYKVENFPVDPKKKLKDSNYRYVTLSPQDQVNAVFNEDCAQCKEFYKLRKNDDAFYALLNNNLSKIFDKMGQGTKKDIEDQLNEIKSCKTKDDRDDRRDKAKKLITTLEKYEAEFIDPLWQDLKEQRKKREKAEGKKRDEIDKRIEELKKSLGVLDDMHDDLETAVQRLAACNLKSEGGRIFDIWGKAHYYSVSSNSTTDKNIEQKIKEDRKKYDKRADEEKKEYLARTGEKKYANDYLYRSKVYQQRANLSTSSYQQKLLELQAACATNVFGYQTNPARCNALRNQLASSQKKSSAMQLYYNNLATKAQDNATNFLNMEAQARSELKGTGSNDRVKDVFDNRLDETGNVKMDGILNPK